MALARKQMLMMLGGFVGIPGITATVLLWTQKPLLLFRIDAGSMVALGTLTLLVMGATGIYALGISRKAKEDAGIMLDLEVRLRETEDAIRDLQSIRRQQEAQLGETRARIRDLESAHRDQYEKQIQQVTQEKNALNARLEDIKNIAALVVHKVGSDYSKSLYGTLEDIKVPLNAFVMSTDGMDRISEHLYKLFYIANDLRSSGRTFNLWLDMQKGIITDYLLSVQLNDVINNAVTEVLRAYEQYQPACNSTLTALPLQVRGYPDALQQVFYILVDNACKYSLSKPGVPGHQQSVLINSGIQRHEAVVTIKDNGVGIPDKQLGSVLNDFFTRGDNVRGSSMGMGIGLKVAKYIIERHGGQIMVASYENVGTEVTVRLPLDT